MRSYNSFMLVPCTDLQKYVRVIKTSLMSYMADVPVISHNQIIVSEVLAVRYGSLVLAHSEYNSVLRFL